MEDEIPVYKFIYEQITSLVRDVAFYYYKVGLNPMMYELKILDRGHY